MIFLLLYIKKINRFYRLERFQVITNDSLDATGAVGSEIKND